MLSNPCSSEIIWHASGNGGIVAAGPKSSVQAGLDILRIGGNAVDAAVAVIFNLAISDFKSFCIGGEVPVMFYNAETKKVKVFNGMGGAPLDKKAIDWFYKNGIPQETKGIRVSAVPSAISTCMKALEINGTLSFREIIQSALKFTDKNSFDWYGNLLLTFQKIAETENNTSGSRGTKIRAARDRLYKGDLADELNDFYINSEGFLRKNDLENHETIVEEAVSINYRGYSINKCNTWTQGPVLLQTLRLLEFFDLKAMGFMSPDYIHVVTEAMKLAYADRDKYYGDPAFTDVPLNKLLSDQYTQIRLPLIDMKKASHLIRPGDPYNMQALNGEGQFFPGVSGTTTCVVIDKWGNVVAATPSANGNYSICKKLGLAHNTRLTSFNTQKGHPNAIEAGKRPRITLTPTIVLKNEKPVLILSVAGKDMQDQVSLQLLLNYIEFNKMPHEAISLPRFHTFHMEDSFNPHPLAGKRFQQAAIIETDFPNQKVIKYLQKRGHIINSIQGPIAYPVMACIDQNSGISYAAAEPLYCRIDKRGKFCGALKI